MTSQKNRSFLFTLVSLCVGAVFAELMLHLASLSPRCPRFELLRRHWAENLHWYQAGPPEGLPPAFDDLLGWRNRADSQSEPLTLNTEKWRSQNEFSSQKTRPRIALAGDSYVFGWRVADDETIASHLFRDLEGSHEVMNFGVHGYGIDQIALVATKIVPQFQPDIIVVGFIAADLDRSCTNFEFGAKKPLFTLKNESLELTGVPVLTPAKTYENFLTHKATAKAQYFLTRSLLVNLLSQPLLLPEYQFCREKLNPAILASLYRERSPFSSVFLVHLDGELPRGFVEEMGRLNVPFSSIPFEELSKQYRIPVERHPDGHPKSSLYSLYALGIKQLIFSPS